MSFKDFSSVFEATLSTALEPVVCLICQFVLIVLKPLAAIIKAKCWKNHNQLTLFLLVTKELDSHETSISIAEKKMKRVQLGVSTIRILPPGTQEPI